MAHQDAPAMRAWPHLRSSSRAQRLARRLAGRARRWQGPGCKRAPRRRARETGPTPVGRDAPATRASQPAPPRWSRTSTACGSARPSMESSPRWQTSTACGSAWRPAVSSAWGTAGRKPSLHGASDRGAQATGAWRRPRSSCMDPAPEPHKRLARCKWWPAEQQRRAAGPTSARRGGRARRAWPRPRSSSALVQLLCTRRAGQRGPGEGPM
mmetsp:Transcript_16531/g.53900  ORF Transcript_16531/g.53900 Transcript_16531/m.53900 type:complete len:211 (+) Transcript_16531:880-1512(+)